MDGLAGVTEMDTSDAETSVKLAVALIPPRSAAIVAAPAVRRAATPEFGGVPFTVATAGADELQ
jgi:hypothetical protein